MEIEQVTPTSITIVNDDWGEGPFCVEGIPATISLPASASRVHCFALDPSGNHKKEVPVEPNTSGGCTIAIAPEFQTVWYEIDIQ